MIFKKIRKHWNMAWLEIFRKGNKIIVLYIPLMTYSFKCQKLKVIPVIFRLSAEAIFLNYFTCGFGIRDGLFRSLVTYYGRHRDVRWRYSNAFLTFRNKLSTVTDNLQWLIFSIRRFLNYAKVMIVLFLSVTPRT